MSEANRSLSACLRCRRQKLKCDGPSRVPCQRCRASKAECVFVPPKAAHSRDLPSRKPGTQDVRLELVEQRLRSVETELRGEIQQLHRTVAQLSRNGDPNAKANDSLIPKKFGEIAPSTHLAAQPSEPISGAVESYSPSHVEDIVYRGIVTENDWDELYHFYHEKCKAVIGFFDDLVYPPPAMLRRHRLMSTVICCIAARATKPEKYRFLIAEADALIAETFQGPSPDFLALCAMMLLAAWTARTRLWGYIASVAADLKLNECALQLNEDSIEKTESIVERARLWFTLCCFDLQINLSRPFVINRMKDYLLHAKGLLSSPFRRPVDRRICAHIEGFTVLGDAKAHIQSAHLQTRPLPQAVVELLTSYDQRVDAWFHEINNSIDPLFQTFSEKQDRNRFLIPYTFLKLYINGLALHGVESSDDVSDKVRFEFIQRALESACLLIQTQYESDTFRRGLRYTMDYNGTTTYHASNFIIKTMNLMHEHLDCRKLLTALHQVAQLFEQAGKVEAAGEMRREKERFEEITHTVLTPESYTGVPDWQFGALFDIPSFLDEATWNDEFPAINMYNLD